MEDFLTALGLVLIIEGIPYFLVPGKMRNWVRVVAELPDSTLRGASLIMMILGLAVVWMVRGVGG